MKTQPGSVTHLLFSSGPHPGPTLQGGEGHGRGRWGMAEREGGRPVGGRQLEMPTH